MYEAEQKVRMSQLLLSSCINQSQSQYAKIITIKQISWVIALKWKSRILLTNRGLHKMVDTLHDYIFRYISLNDFLSYDLNGQHFPWLHIQIHFYHIFLFYDLNVIESCASDPIDKSALVQAMTWRPSGDNLLPEPITIQITGAYMRQQFNVTLTLVHEIVWCHLQ